ncbi:hypothetical protein [Streptomyces sudanensis]|uniref:hypothetical protein n=1 Tax=Streptomyces sudanensis TaxID=436397 RepID=UPI0020CBAB16|nr:hypothetical protein [Streptomyces sudanensis]MCP9958741.1 hypothetical protein [Streptomyces sudanensis]MCQ0000766.1 hypothetical protein [Streptomyces sudanensis]
MRCETSSDVEGAFAGVWLGRYEFCSSSREETYEGRRYVVIVSRTADDPRPPSAVRRPPRRESLRAGAGGRHRGAFFVVVEHRGHRQGGHAGDTTGMRDLSALSTE